MLVSDFFYFFYYFGLFYIKNKPTYWKTRATNVCHAVILVASSHLDQASLIQMKAVLHHHGYHLL